MYVLAVEFHPFKGSWCACTSSLVPIVAETELLEGMGKSTTFASHGPRIVLQTRRGMPTDREQLGPECQGTSKDLESESSTQARMPCQ